MALTEDAKGAAKKAASRSGGVRFKVRRYTVGAMVTVSIALAALLMVMLQFIAFKSQRPLKWDLTSSGINSLSKDYLAYEFALFTLWLLIPKLDRKKLI